MPLPAQPPSHYCCGDDAEAAWVAMDQKACWRETPGALDWLKASLKTLQRAEDERTLDDAGCPACEGPMRQRSRNLNIMLEPFFVMIARQQCLYCPNCDLPIAQAENVETAPIQAFQGSHPEAIGNDYFAIGSSGAKDMRNRPDGPLDPEWAREHTIMFRSHRRYTHPWDDMLEQYQDQLSDLIYGPDDDPMHDNGFDFSDFDEKVDAVHELPASAYKSRQGAS